MKRFFLSLVLIAGLLAAIPPNANATDPVYSDSNLPILENVTFELEVIDSSHLRGYVEFTASYKVNPLVSVTFNFNAPTYTALEQPCMSETLIGTKGEQTLTDLGNNRTRVKSVLNIALNQFISGRTLDICQGKWGLTPISGAQTFGTSIVLYDSAGHWRKYFSSSPFPTIFNQDSFFQTSSLWELQNTIKPNCRQINQTIFSICDSPFDFSRLMTANLEITDKVISDVKNKETEIAAAKAAAELKAKQEAEAKAAAELKARQEAESLLAAAVNAKQEAEAKAAAAKAAKDAATKKTTITCVKGKLTKKVTDTKPKCPTGYKLKK